MRTRINIRLFHNHVFVERGRKRQDDGGSSPFSIDVKPKHGSPDVALDIAFQKIGSRVRGTQMASEYLRAAA